VDPQQEYGVNAGPPHRDAPLPSAREPSPPAVSTDQQEQDKFMMHVIRPNLLPPPPLQAIPQQQGISPTTSGLPGGLPIPPMNLPMRPLNPPFLSPQIPPTSHLGTAPGPPMPTTNGGMPGFGPPPMPPMPPSNMPMVSPPLPLPQLSQQQSPRIPLHARVEQHSPKSPDVQRPPMHSRPSGTPSLLERIDTTGTGDKRPMPDDGDNRGQYGMKRRKQGYNGPGNRRNGNRGRGAHPGPGYNN
jgi:hypothetical protein